MLTSYSNPSVYEYVGSWTGIVPFVHALHLARDKDRPPSIWIIIGNIITHNIKSACFEFDKWQILRKK
jgi:hypothetical protein